DRFVPRGLVRRLMQESEGGRIASEVRPVTVLFTDIAGFTAFAEDRPAAEVAEFLNEHFSLVDRCVDGEGGTIDKYVGDAVMAFWGAPERHRDHAIRAARAAIAIARAVEDDNRRRAEMGEAPVRLRIGVQSGEVLVGVIGSPRRLNYTIIGDAVNTAERLEGLARELGLDDGPVQIVVGEDTARELGSDFVLRPLGRHALAGRRDQVEAFALDWRQSEGAEPVAAGADEDAQSRLRPSRVSSDIE
nr:adenylate/guanylate cyclase domain-containing protein [Alphaproteobacteria bacterium]